MSTCASEGLLWLSELRTKPNFPKIVRVPPEPGRHKPPAEIDVKAPPLPPQRKSESRPAAADIKPMPKPENKSSTQPEPRPTARA